LPETDYQTDYLIIGAGALGLGFADQILTETDASLIIVDRHHAPGGHWNDAYPFVRLHQPSAFYGVGSRDLGSNQIDGSGINKGYYELASGAEVQTYFERLVKDRFLPSGRVRYLPLCEFREDGSIHSLASGKVFHVAVNKKIVDATFFNTAVPSVCPTAYEYASGVKLVPPNDLPREIEHHQHFTIVGGGKTGMDVAVWLLGNGVDQSAIRWIVPRDSWLINRETTQPGDQFYARFLGAKATQLECCARAESVEHLFELLERQGQLLRIDKNVRPTMYHNATIAPAEVELLARIKDVIRLGRVERIGNTGIELQRGDVPAIENSLYIDCSASAISRRSNKQVFDGKNITIQMIRAGLFSLSASVIAHVEANYESDDEKNHLCMPLMMPNADTDWLVLNRAEGEILRRWSADKALRNWVGSHRLAGASLRSPDIEQTEAIKAIKLRIRDTSEAAAANLDRLLNTLESAE
jgi:hypothetical protein